MSLTAGHWPMSMAWPDEAWCGLRKSRRLSAVAAAKILGINPIISSQFLVCG
jgi:hypothetical protein